MAIHKEAGALFDIKVMYLIRHINSMFFARRPELYVAIYMCNFKSYIHVIL